MKRQPRRLETPNYPILPVLCPKISYVFEHAPYSDNFDLCHYFLLEELKFPLKGRRFNDSTHIQNAVTYCLLACSLKNFMTLKNVCYLRLVKSCNNISVSHFTQTIKADTIFLVFIARIL